MPTHSLPPYALQPARPDATAPAAEYDEKPVISAGALRVAVLGLLAVAGVVGSLLVHWLHTPATPPPAQPVQVAPR